MRVVVDTNVLVSGVFWGGYPSRVLDLWAHDRFDLILSVDIVADMTQPASDITVDQGDSVTISWNGTDPDDAALVSVGYDEDNTYNNGNHTWIALTQPEDGSTSWDTTGVAPGTYYIFGMIYDGEADSYDYAAGRVTVTALDAAAWPMYGRDSKNSSCADVEFPAPVDARWPAVDAGGSSTGSGASSPIISDGSIIVSSLSGVLLPRQLNI